MFSSRSTVSSSIASSRGRRAPSSTPTPSHNTFRPPRKPANNNRPLTGASSIAAGAGAGNRRRSRSRTRTARPRSAVSVIGAQAQEVICAINEARGIAATVGLAFVNLSTGECFMSQICDTQTYVRTLQKLSVFDPLEIVIPDTATNPGNSKLLNIVGENLPGANVIPINRKYYNESAGIEFIKNLSFTEDTEAIMVATSEKFYAMSAVAAVLKFIEVSHNVSFTPKSLRMSYQASEGTMLVDFNTVRNLEFVQNLQDPRSTDSLYGLLNNALTPMGGRLLRTNILQPLTSKSVIETRLEAVQELITSEEMYTAVRQALKPFLDVDRLLTGLITVPAQATLKTSEQSINDIIMLKKEINGIGPVCTALAGAQSLILKQIHGHCALENIESIKKLIEEFINEDVTWAKSPLELRNQRCYAIKSGVNGLLDVARLTYKETTEDVHSHKDELAAAHEIQLELKFESQRGYYFRIPTAELEERRLPPVFINIVTHKKFTEFMTLGLSKLNSRISESLTEVLLSSDKTVQELLNNIRSEISSLYKVCEGIAMLDMLQSFACLALSQDYVSPEFADALAITNGRHPVREKIHKEKFIPNDVYATHQSRFQIITGCNMSGKSTYIRQIALLSIMAQIGSLIPATYASFPVTRHMFTRVSTDDNLEMNVSTFAAEMRETAFILHNVEQGSLVIIDELGRGTSSRDGLALAIAISEALIETKALVFFATHFRELPHILSERSGVVNMYMQVEMSDSNRTMNMLYKINNGVVKEAHYGLALARIAGLPNDILDRAADVSRTLVQKAQQKNKSSKSYREARRRRLLLNLHENLVQAKDGKLSEQALKSFLISLQNEFTLEMYKFQEEEDEEEEEDELDQSEESVNETSETTLTTSETNRSAFTTTDSERETDDDGFSSTPIQRSGYFGSDALMSSVGKAATAVSSWHSGLFLSDATTLPSTGRNNQTISSVNSEHTNDIEMPNWDDFVEDSDNDTP